MWISSSRFKMKKSNYRVLSSSSDIILEKMPWLERATSRRASMWRELPGGHRTGEMQNHHLHLRQLKSKHWYDFEEKIEIKISITTPGGVMALVTCFPSCRRRIPNSSQSIHHICFFCCKIQTEKIKAKVIILGDMLASIDSAGYQNWSPQ